VRIVDGLLSMRALLADHAARAVSCLFVLDVMLAGHAQVNSLPGAEQEDPGRGLC